jgi:MOSC domain-containing protein YiiM
MIEGAGKIGTVVSLQRSAGGVPKLPIERASVHAGGMEGDWQRNRKYHGGPDRALCLYSRELLDVLEREGHPAGPGKMGENVTMSGIDWRVMQPGVRVRIGTVEAELTGFAAPCKTIAGAFRDDEFKRVSEKLYPGWSRVYARVLRAGEIAVGDSVEVLPHINSN